MSLPGFALFDSPIGRCGIAWNPQGIAAVQLPEADDATTRLRVAHAAGGAQEAMPPAEVQAAIARIQALLHGARDDLADVQLDLSRTPDFQRRVYAATRAVPPGRTTSYGDIAQQLGMPGSVRAVGQALGHNPFPIIVPCHRVLAAQGRSGGFSGYGGTATKLRMLEIEGAQFGDTPGLF
jgi:methylated-DNA-[protein]-cysteine S-methyltransferase